MTKKIWLFCFGAIISNNTLSADLGPLNFSSFSYSFPDPSPNSVKVHLEYMTLRIGFKTEEGKRWLLNSWIKQGSFYCTFNNTLGTQKTLSIPANALTTREISNDGKAIRWFINTSEGAYRSPRINWGGNYWGGGNIQCNANNIIIGNSASNIYVELDRDLAVEQYPDTGPVGNLYREWVDGGVDKQTTSRGQLISTPSISGLAGSTVKTLSVEPHIRLNVGERKKIGWSTDPGYVPLMIDISGSTQGLRFTSNSTTLNENGAFSWDGRSDINVTTIPNAKWIVGENIRNVNFTVRFP